MPQKIIKNIIVKGSASEIYGLWANFENFPQFMRHIKLVRKMSPNTSHWIMQGPLGKDLEWDAQITDMQPNKRIAWSSISGDLKTSGQVTFNDFSDKGETDITVHMQYVPPVGALGKAAAHLFDNPDKKVEEDLIRFKHFAEKHYTSISQEA